MSTVDTRRPAPERAAALLVFAAASGVILLYLPLAAAPASPSDTVTWWDAVGTPAAAAAIVRGLGVVAAAWLAFASLVALAASLTRSAVALHLFVRTMPPSVRRVVVASTVIVGASAPSLSVAAETDPPPVLSDVGPADIGGVELEPEVVILVDLGPVETPIDVAAAGHSEPAASAVEADTWTVARGDHLWSVAEDTLRDRGERVDEDTTAHLWRRIISANLDVIGDDPDLIHPGMVLTLPV